jgi:hypothetical protein
MFLQKLFASLRVLRRRSWQQPLRETGHELPKRWQELLDVAKQKPFESHTRVVAEAAEARPLHKKTGT